MTLSKLLLILSAAASPVLALADANPLPGGGFTGPADPANFVISSVGTMLGVKPGGASSASYAATGLVLQGGDSTGGCVGGTYGTLPGPCEVTVLTAQAGRIEFDWTYTTNDADGPGGDLFGLVVDNTRTLLSDPGGPIGQSGHIVVQAGQSFGWFLNCTDCTGGAAGATVSGFSLVPVPEPGQAWLLLAGLGGLAGLAGMRRR